MRRFRVDQIGSKAGQPLCEGILGDYIGHRDGLDHYKAEITLLWNPDNIHTKQGEIAIDSETLTEFYLGTEPGRMIDCSKQVEWLD